MHGSLRILEIYQAFAWVDWELVYRTSGFRSLKWKFRVRSSYLSGTALEIGTVWSSTYGSISYVGSDGEPSVVSYVQGTIDMHGSMNME